MDLREILFAQFPAFFLLSLLFLIAHLRVRKHSAVKSVLWVLLFGAALAVSILFCFLGMQAKYWTVKTLFELKFWSWLGLAIVVFVFVLRLVFKLQNKHAQHMVEKERAKAEKTREEAVKQAREEGRARPWPPSRRRRPKLPRQSPQRMSLPPPLPRRPHQQRTKILKRRSNVKYGTDTTAAHRVF